VVEEGGRICGTMARYERGKTFKKGVNNGTSRGLDERQGNQVTGSVSSKGRGGPRGKKTKGKGCKG